MASPGRACLCIVCPDYYSYLPHLTTDPSPKLPPTQELTVLYVRAIDGATIELENDKKVRYIGSDTPETQHPYEPVEVYGKEEYEANRKLVEVKMVRLELDIQKRDRYGRLLAHVYVGNIFVNAQLVKQGYAQVVTFGITEIFKMCLTRRAGIPKAFKEG